MSQKGLDIPDENPDRFVREVSGVIGNLAESETVNMRAAAGADSAILHILFNGDEITVAGEEMNAEDKWYLVTAGNKSGWVHSQYVIIGEPCK